MIVTSEINRQSKFVYDYCLGKLEHSPILRKLIKNVKSGEIQLTNGCSILIFPCNQARVRAPSILVFGGDEFCFWKTEGRSMDKEVLDAARPGLIFPHSKMIKLSSLNRMSGEGFNDHRRYYGVDGAPVLVLKGSTEFFFPGFSKSKLAAARNRDPAAYEQEYMCQFRLDESSMYDPLQVDVAINYDRPLELPYRSDVRNFFCFVDVAVVGIMHLNKKEESSVITRVSGSGAFVAAARAVWLIARDKEDKGLFHFVSIKLNLVEKPSGLSYRIKRDVITFENFNEEDIDPEELLSRDEVTESPKKEAKEFLMLCLEDGKERDTAEILDRAKVEGIAMKTLKRAKAEMRIISKETRIDGKNKWTWCLPAHLVKKEMAP